MLETPGDPTSSRRRAFRVEARLPIRHRRLSPEEADCRARELAASPSPTPWTGDPALAERLDRIERKVDRLLAQLGIAEARPLSEEDLQDVDLSSTGVRLRSFEPIEPGDDVWVECLVPGDSVRHVRALARAVRTDEAEGSACSAALEFRVLADRDRDALVRFTQDVQRCAFA